MCPDDAQFGTVSTCGLLESPRGRLLIVIVPLGGSAAGMNRSAVVWKATQVIPHAVRLVSSPSVDSRVLRCRREGESRSRRCPSWAR